MTSSEAELKTFVQKRGQLKASLTRFSNFVKKVSEGDDIVELQTRLNAIECIRADFDNVQSKIEFLCDSEIDNDERESFEDSFFKAVSEAQKIIARNSNHLANTSINSNTQHDFSNNIHTGQNTSYAKNAKLPILDLPTFDGDYTKWLQFKDKFNSLIHADKSISNVTKFHYLNSCLKGDAEQALSSLEVTDENYDEAWKLLHDSFEDKKIIRKNHLKKLLEWPQITERSHVHLRKLSEGLQIHLRALKLLGEPTDTWDSIIIHIFSHKLDSVTSQEWKEFSANIDFPTVEEFKTFLKKRYKFLQSMHETDTAGQAELIANKKYENKNIKRYQGNRSLSHVVSLDKISCYFCKNSHYIYQCPAILKLPAKSRLYEIKKLKLCTNCLRSTHTSDTCTSGGCRRCGRKHNSILHFDETSKNGEQTRTKEPVFVNTCSDITPGLVGPVVIKAKIILQTLWQLKLDWDEAIPASLHTAWFQFYNQIQHLNEIKIPRHVICSKPISIQLHSFSDASERAYGTCIYIRVTDSSHNNSVRLLTAKSRVASLKNISLPRLELCRALLSVQLTEKVIGAIDLRIDKIYHWCDSTIITISWISGEPNHSPKFNVCLTYRNGDMLVLRIIRRILYHEALIPINSLNINYGGTGRNGYKKINRHGQTIRYKRLTCQKSEKNTVTLTTHIVDQELFNKFSSLTKLQRVTAWCLRFKSNCISSNAKYSGPLSTIELKTSLVSLIKLIQLHEFSSEIYSLTKSKSVSAKSKLASLNPFLDVDGLIRVGGRLKTANLPYSFKHPIVLPTHHPFTKLVVLHEHYRMNILYALKRLVSRRGICKTIYTDNGRNFVGASNDLKVLQHTLSKIDKDSKFTEFINQSNIDWKFIPPRSPHFGGIWEAAVKSAKHHLKRILSNANSTYEEFYTILTQVEAVLNSRPITPMSNDPNDFLSLTPGHFLIGEPLTAIPQDDIKDIPTN